jgi:hypothetical protein
MIPVDDTIIERTTSGGLHKPDWHDALAGASDSQLLNEASSKSNSLDESPQDSGTDSSVSVAGPLDPERRNKNLQWLRLHFQALNEVGNLVFNNADLWELHQYFFSPVYSAAEESEKGDDNDSVRLPWCLVQKPTDCSAWT